jgi:hypothetical protein
LRRSNSQVREATSTRPVHAAIATSGPDPAVGGAAPRHATIVTHTIGMSAIRAHGPVGALRRGPPGGVWHDGLQRGMDLTLCETPGDCLERR